MVVDPHIELKCSIHQLGILSDLKGVTASGEGLSKLDLESCRRILLKTTRDLIHLDSVNFHRSYMTYPAAVTRSGGLKIDGDYL